MKVRFTDEAKRLARLERSWWRKNRDAKHLFDQELRAARARLKDGPKHQAYGVIEGETVRRLLLEKTRCHVYYVIYETENLVRIVAVWGAARGGGPDFR